MKRKHQTKTIVFAAVFAVANLFYNCTDTYKRIGQEANVNIFPEGVAENFTVNYTEIPQMLKSQDSANSKHVFILRSPLNKNFDNQKFKYQLFPEGVEVDFFDKEGRKNTVVADHAVIYSQTNIIDLEGNVVITTHDGKKLETEKLYWDKTNKWIFTEAKFRYTNTEDGTVMDGEGMDFNNNFTYFNAHKTYGLMTIKEDDPL